MENQKFALSHYQSELKGKICKWCKKRNENFIVPLESEPLERYDHSGGYDVDGFEEKQWLYVVCPKCDYQWSLWKLI